MIVSFDIFGRFEVPSVTLCSPGSVANVNGSQISPNKTFGLIAQCEQENAILNFNAPSEISFVANKDSMDESVFDKIATRMSLYVDGYGYFIIKSCSEEKDIDLNVVAKNVTAESAEVELYECEAPYLSEGVYKFITSPNNDGIINRCASLAPRWTFDISDISSSVRDIERYFADEEYDNLYTFLIECLQTKFDCVFEFDTICRRVKVFSQEEYASDHETEIHISHSNLMSKMTKESSSDDIYTALRVTGGNDLDISYVNPIGGNIIYKFTNRKSVMSPELSAAVTKWEEAVASRKAQFLQDSLSLETTIVEASELYGVYNSKLEELNAAKRVQDNYISEKASSAQLAEAKAAVNTASTAANNAKKQWESKNLSVETKRTNLNALVAKCSLSTSARDESNNPIFTDALLEELSSYIYTADYSNENIVKTDSMSAVQVYNQSSLLMEDAEKELDKVSSENIKFTVSTSDFIFKKDFSQFTEQLRPGCIVWAEDKDDEFSQYHISSISIDFDGKTSDLTFSSRYNKYDIKSLFDEVLGSVSKSASQITKAMNLLDKQNDLNKQFSDFAKDALTLTADNVMASENQDVVINDRGYWGRKLQTDEHGNPIIDQSTGLPLYDSEQVKIINNGVYLTDDDWSSVATAIGKINVGNTYTQISGESAPDFSTLDVYSENNGIYTKVEEEPSDWATSYTNYYFATPNYRYGVAGDVIIGKLIMGNGLYLQAGEDGYTNLVFDERGLSTSSKLSRWHFAEDHYTSEYDDYIEEYLNTGFILDSTNLHTGVLEQVLSIGYESFYQIMGEEASVGFSTNIVSDYGLTIRSKKMLMLASPSANMIIGQVDSEFDEGIIMRTSNDSTIVHFEFHNNTDGSGIISYEGANNKGVYLEVSDNNSLLATASGGQLFGTWKLQSGSAITSDKNKKHDISPVSDKYVDLFDKLSPSLFKYNDGTSDRTHVGFIAQDVEQAVKDAGLSSKDFAGYIIDENGEYSIRYEEIIALNTMEIQKLKARIAELEAANRKE